MSLAVAHELQAEVSAPVPMVRFPEESLLLGSAKSYTRNGLDFYQRCERMAGMVQTRFLWKSAYIITEPDAIADVLVNHPKSFSKPYVLRRLKVLFGEGLLTSDGNVWTQHRRLMQPAFSSDRMPKFVHVVRRNAEAMLSSWRNGEVRDVYPDLVDLCMKNVTQTMFGVYDEELGSIVRALAATCHQLVHAVFDVIRPLPLRFPGRLRRQVERELDALDEYLGRLIAQRSAEPPRNDFLGLLLSGTKLYSPLNRQAILDESVTMLLAGHETTTSALVWSLYLLARHPQQADALADELTSALNGEAPLHRELDNLESLRATLDETLRLYPPTHRIARTVITPVMVGGHLLPAGADVVLPQWAVHRSPRWYEEPEVFPAKSLDALLPQAVAQVRVLSLQRRSPDMCRQSTGMVRERGSPGLADTALSALATRYSSAGALRRINHASSLGQVTSAAGAPADYDDPWEDGTQEFRPSPA